MSILAKQAFAAEFKNRLSTKLTMADADIVIAELINHMALYDIEQNEVDGNRKEFADMIDVYLNTLDIEGRSKKTLYRYKRKLLRFMQHDPTPIRQMTVFNIRQYLAFEKSRGMCDNTLNGDRNIYHAFFGWLHREGFIQMNPTANLSPIKVKKEEKEAFSDVELEKLKDACITPRDKAVYYFLLTTGCRISETVNANRRDVDLQNREIKVLGKGNKERTVYFTPVAAMYIEQYLESRTDDYEALFVGKGSERLSREAHAKQLKKIGANAGVKNVHPHRFRRTLATKLIQNGMSIHEVALLLGHEKIDTTRKYIAIDHARVKSAYQMYS